MLNHTPMIIVNRLLSGVVLVHLPVCSSLSYREKSGLVLSLPIPA